MILKKLKKIFEKKPAEKKIKKKVKEEEVLVLSEDMTYENEVVNKSTKETVQEVKSSTTFGV
jgi:hypothetical protein|tara:strand:- start:142 stop:327 length:186 start_codon:yes stop_codon:yes gene_type:complete